MRTTLTLDDGLVRQLQDEMQARGTTFRQTVESVLRRGLEHGPGSKRKSRFRVEARPMDLLPGIDPGRLRDLDTEIEVERFREVTRRLAKRE